MNQNNNSHNQTPPAPDLDQELLRRKAQEFEAALIELQDKHGMLIIPQQNVTPFGTMLSLIYMSKDEFDRRQKQAQDQPEG